MGTAVAGRASTTAESGIASGASSPSQTARPLQHHRGRRYRPRPRRRHCRRFERHRRRRRRHHHRIRLRHLPFRYARNCRNASRCRHHCRWFRVRQVDRADHPGRR